MEYPPAAKPATSPTNMKKYGRGSCRWARTIAKRALTSLDSVKLASLRASADYYHSQTLYAKSKFQDVLYACRLVAALLRFRGRWTVDMEWDWSMLPELVDHVKECKRGGLLDSIAQARAAPNHNPRQRSEACAAVLAGCAQSVRSLRMRSAWRMCAWHKKGCGRRAFHTRRPDTSQHAIRLPHACIRARLAYSRAPS